MEPQNDNIFSDAETEEEEEIMEIKQKPIEIKKIQCDVCMFYFDDYVDLMIHRETSLCSLSDEKDQVSKLTIVICRGILPSGQVCLQVFQDRKSLFKHKMLYHRNNGATFDVKDNKLVVPKTDYICSKCKKRFETAYRLKEHKISHSNERPYPCRKCPRRFKTKCNLRSHQSVHSKKKPFCCKITGCDRRYKRHNGLKTHLERNHKTE